MEFKNIELHNVRELVYNGESGGYKLSRMPSQVAKKMTANVFAASGCEIRFVPIDNEITVKIKTADGGPDSKVAVYYGSVQSGWREEWKRIKGDVTEIIIPKSPRLDVLKRISKENNLPFSPEVIRVVLEGGRQYEIFDVIGECRPPEADELPKLTYLAYGSSITHGSLARYVSDSYPFRVSENLGCDNLNLGFAGNAKLEREVADYIASECKFDFATLEMGINILGIEPEDFRGRVEYFVSTVAKAHLDKKIFCIDVFYTQDDFLHGESAENRARTFRAILKDVIEKLNLPNTVYIPGLDVLDSAAWLSEDLVHPTARGVEKLAANITSKIKAYL